MDAEADPSPFANHPIDTFELRIPKGPWLADVWLIDRPVRFAAASGDTSCAVSGCEGAAGRAEGDKPRETDVLCVPHRRRHAKQQKMPVREFIEQQAASSRIRATKVVTDRQPHYPPVDFTRVHRRFAHELRYVAGYKILYGGWSDNAYVQYCLRGAIALGACYELTSLLQFPLKELQAMAASDEFVEYLTERKAKGCHRNLALALPAIVSRLVRARPDPWDSDEWHTEDVGYPRETARGRLVHYWSKVTCGWLREGLKAWCKNALRTRTRAWSTIDSYIRGAKLLCRFIDEETGPIEPHELTRQFFLDFVGWAQNEDQTPTDATAVNSLAMTLVQVRQDGYIPQLPDTTFLLRGENVVPKKKLPKPFPADILSSVDTMIAEDSELPNDIRLLLRVFRATGPRASEALLLKPDCLRHTEGRGYSLEYFMTKTDNWRRIPIPDRLGKDLAAQAQRVVERFGPRCPWLFPYLGRSPRTKTMTRGTYHVEPWDYNHFVKVTWAAYQRNGIVCSTTTGETLRGPALHRFRHSVATGLLNEGWSQYEVQQFLGHTSSTMMQSYAEIHEDTLRTKYKEFVKHAIDVNGQKHTHEIAEAADRERLRDRMIRSTLPNGYCTLPEKQTCDFVPTPCLSCTPFFRTTPTFLPVHIRQRDETMRQLDQAQQDGRERAVEAHEKTLDRLNTIIGGLEIEAAKMEENKAAS